MTKLLHFNSKVRGLNNARIRNTEESERKINFDPNSEEGRFNLMNMNTEDKGMEIGSLLSPNGSGNKGKKKLKVMNPMKIMSLRSYELNPK